MHGNKHLIFDGNEFKCYACVRDFDECDKDRALMFVLERFGEVDEI